MNPKISKNIVILSATSLLQVTPLYTWLFLLPIYLKNLGANDPQIGLSYSFFGFAYTFAQFFGGYLSDRFGRKYLIVIPTWLLSVFYMSIALTSSWIYVTVSYFLASVAYGFQSPSFTSMIAESIDEKKMGTGFSIFQFSSMFGIAFGLLLGSSFVGVIGIKGLVIITSLVVLIGAIIRQLKLIEPVQKHRKPPPTFVFNKNHIWFIIAGSLMFFCLSLTINGPFLTLFQEENLGLKESKINMLYGFAEIPAAVLCLIAGLLTDKLGGKKIMTASIMIHTLSTFFWVFFLGNIFFLISSFVFAQFFYVSYQEVISKITLRENRARFVGFFGTISGLVSSIGPYIGMYVKIKAGFAPIFQLCFILAAISSLFLSRISS